jgi:hypothetical protein
LDEPAQYDLGDGLAVRCADLGEGRVGEEVVAAFGERSPGLDLDAALAHELLVGGALVEGVRLDLVHRRGGSHDVCPSPCAPVARVGMV